jgi:hypothetical protein
MQFSMRCINATSEKNSTVHSPYVKIMSCLGNLITFDVNPRFTNFELLLALTPRSCARSPGCMPCARLMYGKSLEEASSSSINIIAVCMPSTNLMVRCYHYIGIDHLPR